MDNSKYTTPTTTQMIVKWLVIIGLLSLLIKPSMEAWRRQFDTQFFGLDVAGEYILEHKSKDKQVHMINSGHQSFGAAWHGDIKAYRGMPQNLSLMKKVEEDRYVEWILVYQWALDVRKNRELWEYMQAHYHLEQVGFMLWDKDQPVLYYYLLKRGGNFNESNLDELVEGKLVETRLYETTHGEIPFHYINIIKNENTASS